MEAITKRVPLLAFVLAAFAAVAFTFPEMEVTSRFGAVGSDIYDVTNVDMGPGADEYQCNAETSQCLFQDQQLQNPVPGALGEFDPGESLIPIN